MQHEGGSGISGTLSTATRSPPTAPAPPPVRPARAPAAPAAAPRRRCPAPVATADSSGTWYSSVNSSSVVSQSRSLVRLARRTPATKQPRELRQRLQRLGQRDEGGVGTRAGAGQQASGRIISVTPEVQGSEENLVVQVELQQFRPSATAGASQAAKSKVSPVRIQRLGQRRAGEQGGPHESGHRRRDDRHLHGPSPGARRSPVRHGLRPAPHGPRQRHQAGRAPRRHGARARSIAGWRSSSAGQRGRAAPVRCASVSPDAAACRDRSGRRRRCCGLCRVIQPGDLGQIGQIGQRWVIGQRRRQPLAPARQIGARRGASRQVARRDLREGVSRRAASAPSGSASTKARAACSSALAA